MKLMIAIVALLLASLAIPCSAEKPNITFFLVDDLGCAIGQIVAVVEDSGLRENTLIIFSTDNSIPPTAMKAKLAEMLQGAVKPGNTRPE